jgi:hypothetical protein
MRKQVLGAAVRHAKERGTDRMTEVVPLVALGAAFYEDLTTEGGIS